MIQIIKENRKPSFGEKFSNAIGAGLEEYSKLEEKKKAEADLKNENDTLRELTGKDLSGIKDPQLRRSMVQDLMKSLPAGVTANSEEDVKSTFLDKLFSEIENDPTKITDKQIIEATSINPALGKSLETSKKDAVSKQKETDIKNTAQKSLNGIAKLVKEVGVGTDFWSMAGGKTSKAKGKFSALTGGIESMLVDMVSRGTLSDSRFKYITETLMPKPTDTQQEIIGKLEGLSDVLGLDKSEIENLVSQGGASAEGRSPIKNPENKVIDEQGRQPLKSHIIRLK